MRPSPCSSALGMLLRQRLLSEVTKAQRMLLLLLLTCYQGTTAFYSWTNMVTMHAPSSDATIPRISCIFP